jgi:hypothetical protein
MNQSSDPQVGQAYTRASVEAYLRAAASERSRLESAIAEARARTVDARRVEEQLRAGNVDPDAVVVGDDESRPPVVESSDSLTERLPFAIDGQPAEWREQDVPAAVARD